MIETLADFPDNVVAVACSGQVTRRDYDTVLVPRVEQALARHAKLRLYYQVGADFAGIDPAAMWADFKVGVGHLTRWERIAVVTDVDWIRHTVGLFGFMMPCEVRTFPLAEAPAARAWIVAA